MKDILTIAAALEELYFAIHEEDKDDTELTEMRMHKLLYFAQKEHYKNFGEWLFREDFEGWVHGPVNKQVRDRFESISPSMDSLSLKEEYTLREVVMDYGMYATSYLRELSHQDQAYKHSRIGLDENDRGQRVVLKDKMVEDISKEQKFSMM